MNFSTRDREAPDNLVLPINADMVLVSIVAFAMSL